MDNFTIRLISETYSPINSINEAKINRSVRPGFTESFGFVHINLYAQIMIGEEIKAEVTYGISSNNGTDTMTISEAANALMALDTLAQKKITVHYKGSIFYEPLTSQQALGVLNKLCQ